MNLIRGIDRISWIIAVLAVPIGFAIGFGVTSEKYKTVSAAYQAWEKEYGDVVVTNPSSPLHGSVVRLADRPEPPEKYEYPAWWKSLIGGTLFAIFFFFVTIAIIRFSARGLKKLSLWVADGFRGK